MTSPVVLTPLDTRYPSRLRSLPRAPASLTTQGGPLEADVVVAIIGSRKCRGDAARYARRLALRLARLGAVVVSGGALGIDAAAHRGALAAGGRTWVVAGTGHELCYPREHAHLYATIARGPGAMIWPYGPQFGRGFVGRNRILVALADAVVIVQAGKPSGALGAASHARALGRPLWVVPPAPWFKGAEGSELLLDQGARPLYRTRLLLESLGLRGRARSSQLGRELSPCELAVLHATSSAPLHLDDIATRAQAPAQATAAALLTLALENVVVEGPPGFYRRRDVG